MRMELPGRISPSGKRSPSGKKSPSGRTSPSGKTTPKKEISAEKEVKKLELNPDDNLVELDVEDSVPAGWKMAKFGSDLDLLLTSPQVRLNAKKIVSFKE